MRRCPFFGFPFSCRYRSCESVSEVLFCGTDREPLSVLTPQERQPGEPEPGSISAAAAELARRRWEKQQAEGQAETPAPEEAVVDSPAEDEAPVADDPEVQESDDTDGLEDGGEVEETDEEAAPDEESDDSDL